MQQLSGPIKYQEWNLDTAKMAVQEFRGRTGGVMLALHRIQQLFGYIDPSAMAMLGKVFNLSRAEIHGVASFYHDYKTSKPGKYTVKVCQAEACQAMGSVKLTHPGAGLLPGQLRLLSQYHGRSGDLWTCQHRWLQGAY